jgi:hypothetical protein
MIPTQTSLTAIMIPLPAGNKMKPCWKWFEISI